MNVVQSISCLGVVAVEAVVVLLNGPSTKHHPNENDEEDKRRDEAQTHLHLWLARARDGMDSRFLRFEKRR